MSIGASKEPSHRNCIESSKKNRIEFDYSQPQGNLYGPQGL